MEDNYRKGPGVFYAVVGVATLVVAIIGATFAFFSARAEDLTTIQGNIASAGGVHLVVSPLAATAEGETKNLIPLNVNANETELDPTSQFASAMNQKCIDNNGNQVCQVYAIKVANKSTTSTIQIRGTMTLTSKAKNLHWKLINVTDPGSNGFSWDTVSGKATDTIVYSADTTKFTATEFASEAVKDNVVGGTLTGEEATTITHYLTVGSNSNIESEQSKGAEYARRDLGYTNADNTVVYYVLVWLEETGAAQEGEDAAAGFNGTVTIEAVDANGTATGVTASF